MNERTSKLMLPRLAFFRGHAIFVLFAASPISRRKENSDENCEEILCSLDAIYALIHAILKLTLP